ncbi:ATP-binding cassette domain-containing protein [Microbacterium sp. MEC084]|uniref:ABC transporter ATP-binding protein n=1 Tax=unclassified Microbacterium TaxID=2609290 RepID=UPI0006FBC42E|nr:MULTISPECIES: ATP-binding cassette domain-containing protein [unclassified Microbacterium]KQZ11741.1 hypothetical protein ASD19_00180 [Microbacterium sp. Root53]MCD1269379.1 ATP-binding cassette domain-containing protein [Microbacterium sp. MEC084]
MTAPADEPLRGTDLWFGYDGEQVLRGASIAIEPGEVVALWGPSGCGKSTLGKVLAGWHKPDRGEVSGPPATGRARPTQLVLQHSGRAMNPRWKIREVLAEGGSDLDEVLRTRLVRSEWLDAFSHELSGGQLQRVNLARALLAKPRHVIADEITASLDPITQAQIWQILLDGVRRDGIGVLAISHDRALLDRVADRIVAMDDINA